MTSVVSCSVSDISAAENNDHGSPCNPTTKKSNGKRKSASLPGETVEYLKAWMMSPEHIAHPYPTEQEKVDIMKDTNIELKQLTNWFVNNRKRYWKPRVEARLQQQAQAAQAAVQAHAAAVSATQQQQHQHQHQRLIAGVSPESARSNLVTPSVGLFKLKLSSPSSLSPEVIKPSPIKFVSAPSPPPSLLHQSFVTSPLTLMAHMIDRRSKMMISLPETSTTAVTVAETSSTSSTPAASVSASEGEMSDSGNTSDDTTSDGPNIPRKDLSFIHLKMKKKQLLKSKSSTPIAPSTIAPSVSSSETPQESTTTTTRPIYARSVSFCSLDKISSEATSRLCNMKKNTSEATPRLCSLDTISSEATSRLCNMDMIFSESTSSSSSTLSTCKEIEIACSSKSKKRSIDDNELPLVVATCINHVPQAKRFRTVSFDLWRKKCDDATHHFNDEALPSLDEAAHLFGFISA